MWGAQRVEQHRQKKEERRDKGQGLPCLKGVVPAVGTEAGTEPRKGRIIAEESTTADSPKKITSFEYQTPLGRGV